MPNYVFTPASGETDTVEVELTNGVTYTFEAGIPEYVQPELVTAVVAAVAAAQAGSTFVPTVLY